MISQSAEYALRAVMCLAAHTKPLTTQQVADVSHVPPGYLSKILQTLVRAGIVTSQRGVNGGFVLARPADGLSLLDIVRTIDPSHRIRACPLKLEAHKDRLCPLHTQLDAAAATMEDSLRRITVAHLLAESHSHDALCQHACDNPSNTTCPHHHGHPAVALKVATP